MAQQTYDRSNSQEPRASRFKPTSDDLDAWSESTQGKFSPAEVELVFTDCPPETTAHDFKKFLYNCTALDINPLLNEAHLEYRNEGQGRKKMVVVTHIDAYRRRAAEKDILDGLEQ